ncbi:phosphoribosylformylglycinamidine synthase subunit PurQ [Hyphomonas oceanitis]|uniref:Phosphoribosylformylglycinamidine synthase subunit PurQ n=1 Tax=Hyphomonas oceanitis SCH89 TaxID=1280953 RepID=A0A059G450_9PROT|nr:phosphoribosylformylglycinamidine synthase subunit PurQ [Hyphomonas oceanitis]KDA01258.1 phosphoribosylformylglycinamidine synthase I [Hyphomonas oceanitis SCH89]
MKTAVIVFPASNCDRDAQDALAQVTGKAPAMVWHKDGIIPEDTDLVVIPGGFSYGDYLRCGAMAANSPVVKQLKAHAERGGYVLGICNGFQILCETRLLPGVLIRNASLHFVCRPQRLSVESANTAFTSAYSGSSTVTIPIAHHDGNYFADDATLDRLEGEGRVVFRYAAGENPNGASRDIAGILSDNGRVMGMMPHPERAMGGNEGGADGLGVFLSLLNAA